MEEISEPKINKNKFHFGSMELTQIDLSHDDELQALQLDELVNDLRETNELSRELDSLVDSQKEKLDKIEHDVGNGSSVVVRANTQLDIASEHQQALFWQKGSILTVGTVAVTATVTLLTGPTVGIVIGVAAFGIGWYGIS